MKIFSNYRPQRTLEQRLTHFLEHGGYEVALGCLHNSSCLWTVHTKYTQR